MTAPRRCSGCRDPKTETELSIMLNGSRVQVSECRACRRAGKNADHAARAGKRRLWGGGYY